MRHRMAVVATAVVLAAGFSATGARSIGPGGAGTAAGERGVVPIGRMDPREVTGFDLPAPPAGQTPAERAHWMLEERSTLGRAPMEWVRWSQRTFLTDAVGAGATAPGADLAAGVTRLYEALGVPLGAAEAAGLTREAASVPAAVRGPFADLVSVVADAYAAQLPVAAAVVDARARGFDPHTPLLSAGVRDAMATRSAAVVAAVRRFRAQTAPFFAEAAVTGGPIFSDPEDLVVLGGTGDDTYTRSGLFPDPILLVDPAGSDTYANSAGGACPVSPEIDLFFLEGRWLECNSLVVSVVADLGDGVTAPSDDAYVYNGPPAAVQGAGGPGGLGILIDVGGNDRYEATMTRGNVAPFVTYYFDGGAQGYGYAGEGLLLDGLGDDLYRFDVASSHGRSIWAFAQGFGAAGGLGISIDGDGVDQWLSNGLGIAGAFDDAFQGLYTDGVGFYGGVGIMADLGGDDDVYDSRDIAQTTDYYAQGFGAFGGLGVLYEDGGDDSYYAYEAATNPWIDPLLSCAYGTASFGGVGAMVDVSGNDTYVAGIDSPTGVSLMSWGDGSPGIAYGVFADTGGDDRYELQPVGSTVISGGWGVWHPTVGDPIDAPLGENTFGAFLDAGGTDTYVGAPPGVGNGAAWPFGADVG